MKNIYTRKIILLSAIAVLAAIYVLQISFESRTKVKVFYVEKEIDFVSVSKNGSEIFFIQKADDGWTANAEKIPVAENKANGIVNNVNEIKILDAMKFSESDSERYGLNAESCITVEAKSGGNTVRVLKIGKATSTGSQCYIQLDGEKNIFLAQGLLRSTFDVTADDIKKVSAE